MQHSARMCAIVIPSPETRQQTEQGTAAKLAMRCTTMLTASCHATLVLCHPKVICVVHTVHCFARLSMRVAEQVRTTRTFLRDCTVVSPMALLLFGGALEVRHEAGLVTVDGWLRIRAPAPTAVLVKKLRAALDALLERKARPRAKSVRVRVGLVS